MTHIARALAGAGGRATYPARLPPRVLGSARRVRWAYAARRSCPTSGSSGSGIPGGECRSSARSIESTSCAT